MSFNNIICNTINGGIPTTGGGSTGGNNNINTSDGLGGFQSSGLTLNSRTISAGIGNNIQLDSPLELTNNSSALCPVPATLSTYQFKTVAGTANILSSTDLVIRGTIDYVVMKMGRQVTWMFGTDTTNPAATFGYRDMPNGSYGIIDFEVPEEFRPFGAPFGAYVSAYLDADVGTLPAPLTWVSSGLIQYTHAGGFKWTIIDTSAGNRSFDLPDMDAYSCTVVYIAQSD